MDHSTSAPNERVWHTTQLAKLSFNHPSVVLTPKVFPYFYKIVGYKQKLVHPPVSSQKRVQPGTESKHAPRAITPFIVGWPEKHIVSVFQHISPGENDSQVHLLAGGKLDSRDVSVFTVWRAQVRAGSECQKPRKISVVASVGFLLGLNAYLFYALPMLWYVKLQ